jgi:phosphohistidine phosphatase SixA
MVYSGMTPSLPAVPGRVPRAAAVALALCLLSLLPPAVRAQAPAGAAAPPALVLVVRHAEKVDNSDDPALSAIGIARADALANALSDAGVAHVIVTHRQRTRLTAAPLMTSLGLEPEVVAFGRDMDEHVRNVAAAVRRQAGKVVLVVGHSNTVPMIVHALGGPRMPDLCDARYGGLFAVVPRAVGSPAGVIVSSFGAPDPPEALSCAGMVPR